MLYGSSSYGSSTYGGLNAFNIFSKAISAVLALSDLNNIQSDKKISAFFSIAELEDIIKEAEKRNNDFILFSETNFLINSFLVSVNENINFSYSISKQIYSFRVDNLNILETNSFISDFLVSVNENIDFSHSISKQIHAFRIGNLNVSESLSSSAEYKRTLSSKFNIFDFSKLDLNKIIKTNIYLTSVLTLLSEYKVSCSDNLELVKETKKEVEKSNLDSFVLNEIIHLISSYEKKLEDVILLSENLIKSFTLELSLSFSIYEIKIIISEYNKRHTEKFSLVDLISLISEFKKENVESIHFSEEEKKETQKNVDTLFLSLLSAEQINTYKKIASSISFEDVFNSDLQILRNLFSNFSLEEYKILEEVKKIRDVEELTEFISTKTTSELRFLHELMLSENISKRPEIKINDTDIKFSEYSTHESGTGLSRFDNFDISESLKVNSAKVLFSTLQLIESLDTLTEYYKKIQSVLLINDEIVKERELEKLEKFVISELSSISKEKKINEMLSISIDFFKYYSAKKGEIVLLAERALKDIILNKKISLSISEMFFKNISFGFQETLFFKDEETSSFVKGLNFSDEVYITLDSLKKEILAKKIETISLSKKRDIEITHKLSSDIFLSENITKEQYLTFFDLFNFSEAISKRIYLKEDEALLVTEDKKILEELNIQIVLPIVESTKKLYYAEIIDSETFEEFISRSKDKIIEDYITFEDSTDRKAERSIAPRTVLLTRKRKTYLLMR